MKNSFKKLTKYLSLVVLLLLWITPAMAADNDYQGSIYLDLSQCTTPLGAVECSLYQITTIDDKGVQTLNSPYHSINVNLDALTNASYWQAFSENLENFINFYTITPELEFSTDEEGNYFIDNLEWGIYYIQIDHVHDAEDECDYCAEPILIMIGSTDTADTDLNDEFTVVPKISIITEEPEYEEPDDDDDEEEEEEEEEDDEDDEEEEIEEKEEKEEIEEEEEEVYEPYNLNVKKVWQNTSSDLVILDAITIEIRCNGETYAIVELSEKNMWSFDWTDDDKNNIWAVMEITEMENFSTNYENNLFTFTVTNTYEKPDEYKEEIIETGYYGYLVPTLASLGMISILLGLILKGKSRKPKVKG